MQVLVMIGQVVFALALLVGLHEAGHMIAAKAFGMRVEKFSIGFPPKIWSFKRGDTEYQIGCIPLGGFVKISGMVDESLDTKDLDKPPEPYEFRAKPAWQRLIVMMGGIIVNIITGIVIYIIVVYTWGKPYIPIETATENGVTAYELAEKKLGLKTGDIILEVSGTPAKDLFAFNQLKDADVLLGSDANYKVLRKVNGKDSIFTVSIPNDFVNEASDTPFIGHRYRFRIGKVLQTFEFTPEHKVLSSADSIGVQKGDNIVAIGSKKIEFWDQLSTELQDYHRNAFVFNVARNTNNDTVEKNLNFRLNPYEGFYFADYLSNADSSAKYFQFDTLGTCSVKDTILPFLPGDVIRNLNKKTFTEASTMAGYITEKVRAGVRVVLERDGERIEKFAILSAEGKLGVIPKDLTKLDTLHFTFGQAISQGTYDAFDVIYRNIQGFGKMFSGDLDPSKSVGGPIKIATMFGGEWKWYRFWYMTGLLSMILAFMNFLPIPALDGGHVMFLLYEMISGRKPSDKFMEVALKIGIFLLIGIMVFAFGNDIIQMIF